MKILLHNHLALLYLSRAKNSIEEIVIAKLRYKYVFFICIFPYQPLVLV